MFQEKRIFCNNSGSKWLSVGILPKARVFNSTGFQLEIFLCGEKASPLPLGGLPGLMSFFTTIRQIPDFSRVPVTATLSDVQPSNNITISTVGFADDVSIYIHTFENCDNIHSKIVILIQSHYIFSGL